MARNLEISFAASDSERVAVHNIARRAYALRQAYAARGAGKVPKPLSMEMDLVATHANGCPMDFAKLEAADDFNLLHDVIGIERHLDRETGQLGDFFRPRCALKQA